MSIYCSNLPNDADMIQALGSVAVPIPVCVDAAFSGVGEDSIPIAVGIERKKIGDIVQCIYDGRYIFQAQNAKEAGYDILCLIVEGRTRSNYKDGLLEIPIWGLNPKTLRRAEMWTPIKPTITYSRFDQYLTELDYLAGIIVKRSANVKETAAVIMALWDNFQRPPDQHNSLHQIFTPSPPHVPLTRPTLRQRVAKELDGIGWVRSQDVAAYFANIAEMVNADVDEWCKVDGIGKVIAEKVVAGIRGGKK